METRFAPQHDANMVCGSNVSTNGDLNLFMNRELTDFHGLSGHPQTIGGFSACIFACSHTRAQTRLNSQTSFQKLGSCRYINWNKLWEHFCCIVFIFCHKPCAVAHLVTLGEHNVSTNGSCQDSSVVSQGAGPEMAFCHRMSLVFLMQHICPMRCSVVHGGDKKCFPFYTLTHTHWYRM